MAKYGISFGGFPLCRDTQYDVFRGNALRPGACCETSQDLTAIQQMQQVQATEPCQRELPKCDQQIDFVSPDSEDLNRALGRKFNRFQGNSASLRTTILRFA
jgi:hypothetical protein